MLTGRKSLLSVCVCVGVPIVASALLYGTLVVFTSFQSISIYTCTLYIYMGPLQLGQIYDGWSLSIDICQYFPCVATHEGGLRVFLFLLHKEKYLYMVIFGWLFNCIIIDGEKMATGTISIISPYGCLFMMWTNNYASHRPNWFFDQQMRQNPCDPMWLVTSEWEFMVLNDLFTIWLTVCVNINIGIWNVWCTRVQVLIHTQYPFSCRMTGIEPNYDD